MVSDDKQAVRDFWSQASCGEDLYLPEQSEKGYSSQAEQRYALEPYILRFLPLEECAGKATLEVGVGLGADHALLAAAGARLSGIDLTDRAIEHTRRRLGSLGLHSDLQVSDAENLPFADSSFDVVYSWGVLHHSPDTQRAFHEVWRVLRPGGVARIMVYHRHSMVGYMLWLRYALAALRFGTSLDEIYAKHLESPGTKAYSRKGARELCSAFSSCDIEVVLTHGDLLESGAGQRHKGLLLDLARRLWPRWMIRRLFSGHGLFMLISLVK